MIDFKKFSTLKFKHMKYWIFLLPLLITAMSCHSRKQSTAQDASSSGSKKDCPEDLMCTMDYRMITVQVKNDKSQNTRLDSISVFLTDNPSVSLTKASAEGLQAALGYGVVHIAEDGNMNMVQKEGSKVTFLGFIAGKQVAKADYVIGHDCCHIKLVSGPKEITLP